MGLEGAYKSPLPGFVLLFVRAESAQYEECEKGHFSQTLEILGLPKSWGFVMPSGHETPHNHHNSSNGHSRDGHNNESPRQTDRFQ